MGKSTKADGSTRVRCVPATTCIMTTYHFNRSAVAIGAFVTCMFCSTKSRRSNVLVYLQTVAMKFILKHGKSDKDIENLRQEIEVSFRVFS